MALLAAAVGGTWLALALLYLARRFPHEDAFILFRYAHNLAGGHGIAFNPGGAPAEGATDFLWMVSLAALDALGLDVAIAAALVNALGGAVCAAVLLSALPPGPVDLGSRWHLLVAPLLLPLSSAAAAAYVGFGSLFYAGVALLGYRLYVAGAQRARLLVPGVGLVLGLIRPDGVVIGVALSMLALAGATAAERPRLLRRIVACAAVGLGYFAWRAWYFGELLPLPLYVKSHSSTLLPGLGGNLAWAAQLAAPLAVLVAALVAARQARSAAWERRVLLGLVPFALHVALLSLGVPTQNVAMRFQAPALLALLLAVQLLVAGASAAESGRARVALAVALTCAWLPQAWMLRTWAVQPLDADPSVDRLALALGRRLGREHTVALTEAGRLPFWTQARVVDLVGLNTRETARRPATVASLRTLAPDLVMFHRAGMLETPRATEAGAPDLLPLTVPLRELVRPEDRALLAAPPLSYDALRLGPVQLAPLIAAAFLSEEQPAYDVYFVRVLGTYDHVYAVKKGIPLSAEFPALVHASQAGGPASYLALRRAAREQQTPR